MKVHRHTPPQRRARAFTLVEMLVALAVFGIIGTMLAGVTDGVSRTVRNTDSTLHADETARAITAALRRDLQQLCPNEGGSPPVEVSGSGGHLRLALRLCMDRRDGYSRRIVWSLDAASGKLQRQEGEDTGTLRQMAEGLAGIDARISGSREARELALVLHFPVPGTPAGVTGGRTFAQEITVPLTL